MRWDGDRGGRPAGPERERVESARARVLTEWGSGKSAVKIAIELGLTEGTVHGIIQRSSGPEAEKAKSDHVRNSVGHDDRKKVRAHKDPARERLVLQRWAEGESASMIGNALGVTRNVVIGIVSRAGEAGKRPHVLAAASRAKGQAKGSETKRERTEHQRARSAKELAEVRERKAAEGREIIAKVEAEAARRRKFGRTNTYGLAKTVLSKIDGPGVDVALELPPKRFRPALAVINTAFVAPAEKPWDPYEHLKSERSYHDAP